MDQTSAWPGEIWQWYALTFYFFGSFKDGTSQLFVSPKDCLLPDLELRSVLIHFLNWRITGKNGFWCFQNACISIYPHLEENSITVKMHSVT